MITMDDIAQHAGVSRATVSYVLNKRKPANGTISDETRSRVLSSASTLKYRTNELARSVVTGKNRVLGVLMTPHSVEYGIRILTGANQAADEKGYMQKILHISDGGINENVAIRCQEWRLAGVMTFGFSEEQCKYFHDEFARIGMPIALVDSAPRQPYWGARVRSDDAQGICLVVSHLISKGHTQIGFLGGRPGSLSLWRKETFLRALTEAGLVARPQWVRESAWGNVEIIEKEAVALLQNPADRPTAIVCSSDALAMVVVRVADSMQLRVPADLSVTGYSNASLSPFVNPPLTTVEQPFESIGRAAALHLIAHAESSEPVPGDTPVEEILIPTRLVERASTAPPPPR